MKTTKDHIENIEAFAQKHGLVFDLRGEVGMGRECVGIRDGSNYVDFNPIKMDGVYDQIPEFYDNRLSKIKPKDAYHKHDCLAVLGRGDDAIRQMSKWVDALRDLGATIVEYRTGAIGIQAMIWGATGKTIRIPKEGAEK